MKGILNGKDIACCGAFHTLIARELNFPDYYGKNLDALYDCLTDLPAGSELVIHDFAAMEAQLGQRYTNLIRRVLDDAAEEGRFSWVED